MIGELYFISLTLVNIHSPNFDSPQFFHFLYLVPDISQTNLIIGNDFSIVIDQYPLKARPYRAIALLNTDQKILAKTLAHRLSSVIAKLIHSDHTSFIPQHNSSSSQPQKPVIHNVYTQASTGTSDDYLT